MIKNTFEHICLIFSQISFRNIVYNTIRVSLTCSQNLAGWFLSTWTGSGSTEYSNGSTKSRKKKKFEKYIPFNIYHIPLWILALLWRRLRHSAVMFHYVSDYPGIVFKNNTSYCNFWNNNIFIFKLKKIHLAGTSETKGWRFPKASSLTIRKCWSSDSSKNCRIPALEE